MSDVPVIKDYKNLSPEQIKELAELDFEIEKAKRIKKLKDLGVDISGSGDIETESALIKTLMEKYGDDAFLIYYALKNRNPAAFFLIKDLVKKKELGKEEVALIEKLVKEGKTEDIIKYIAIKQGDPALLVLLSKDRKDEREDNEMKDVLSTIALSAIQIAYKDLKEGKMSKEEFVTFLSSVFSAIANSGKYSPFAYILPMLLKSESEKGEKKEDTTAILLKTLIEKLPTNQQQQLNLKDIIEGLKLFAELVKGKGGESEAEKWLKEFAQKALARIVEDRGSEVDRAITILDKMSTLAQKTGVLPYNNPELQLRMMQLQMEKEMKQKELELKEKQMEKEFLIKKEQLEYEKKKEEAWRKSLGEFAKSLGYAFMGLAPTPQQQEVQQLPRATCPKCGNVLRIPKGAERIQCPYCNAILRVIWEKREKNVGENKVDISRSSEANKH